MKLSWQIEEDDIRKVKTFYETQKNNAFVLNRIDHNVKKNLPEFTEELFWEAMISCLMTTQQRSGPNSAVTKFICTKPFPLNYHKCKSTNAIQSIVQSTITSFGGLRRGKTIGEEVEENYKWLHNDGWEVIINPAIKYMNRFTGHTLPKDGENSFVRDVAS